MADERIQDLIDYAIAKEPASFADTLADIMLAKASERVGERRTDMATSTLKTRRSDEE